LLDSIANVNYERSIDGGTPLNLAINESIAITRTRFAFEHFSAARLQLCAQKENIQSINFAKRAGFIEEATLKKFRIDCLSKNLVMKLSMLALKKS
jgi:hypothetical protein